MNIRHFLHVGYPNLSFILLATFLSTISFQLTPSAGPIVLTLATLLVYSGFFWPKPGALKNASLLLAGLTLGSSIPKLSASWSALSNPGFSILVLLVSSGITSFFAVLAVLLDSKICQHPSSPWTNITAFPALWATLWAAVAYVSPVGRLSAWSPTYGTGAYSWLVPLLGSAAIDWIIAAWAVVLSQAFAAWFMSENDDKVAPLVSVNGTAKQANHHTRTSIYLAIILSALAIPSLFSINHPVPIDSPDTTPFSVGCVLPSFKRYHHHDLTFEDYFEESKKLTTSARLLLWPESAVVFHNESERDKAFARIRLNITGSYVGVSFEETFPNPNDTTGTKGARRNGLALISKESEEPHLVYYKRKLVPIAESFSLTHSTAPPEIYTIGLPPPSDVKKPDWGTAPNYTRPLPVTTSICLDFTDPNLFQDLPTRPALILAPARTWNIDIGTAMWNQAKQRANELGTMILWCDGGDGGVSGVAGQGYNDVQQVGSGSWVRIIAVDQPLKESRTTYGAIGRYTLLFFWLLASVINPAIDFLPGGFTIKRVRQIAISLMSYIKRRKEGDIRLESEQEPPLLDLEN